MAYESMHDVFVGMISFMTVGGVFILLLYECFNTESKRYY